MSLDYHYLGFVPEGKVVSVRVNQQAHIALIDTTNLHFYVRRQNYRHYGGLQSYQEEKYKIPYSAEWHLMVELFLHSNKSQSMFSIR